MYIEDFYGHRHPIQVCCLEAQPQCRAQLDAQRGLEGVERGSREAPGSQGGRIIEKCVRFERRRGLEVLKPCNRCLFEALWGRCHGPQT